MQMQISNDDLREYFPDKKVSKNVPPGNVPRGTLPKFSNQYNQHLFDHKKESNRKPSMTVPDQALSIKQIMDRFARGLPMGGGFTPVYNGEEDILEGVDPRKLDLVEKAEIKKTIQNTIKNITKKYEANQSQIEKQKVLETVPTDVPRGT